MHSLVANEMNMVGHTCQLTRDDKFSTIKRYSVRNGGPYRELLFLELLCLGVSFVFFRIFRFDEEKEKKLFNVREKSKWRFRSQMKIKMNLISREKNQQYKMVIRVLRH
jgi:hypothetical protein